MKSKRIAALFLALALIFTLVGCGSSKALRWPDSTLGDRLPAPPVKNGEIIVETADILHARAVDASEKHYQRFIEDCEDRGFTIDSKSDNYSFSAYDEDGYFIEVRYTKSSETIDISINVSIEGDFAEFSWPKSEIAGSIPVPKSSIGTISWESENGFVIYIGETSKEDYDDYVDQCYDAGFTIDYSKGDDYFRGINEAGYHLNLDYKWNQTMFVRMDTAKALGKEPPEKTPSSEEPSVPTETIPTQTKPVETDPPIETSTPEPTETPSTEPERVSYSTNDYETAKKGNSGVFSYVDRGANYDIYWIIDFDAGYVYYFTEGNGEESCDRIAIESGDLNDVLIITYHDGGDEWSYGLHFNYKNNPSKLIMQDNNGFEYEYTTTDLTKALELRDGKTIRDY